MPTFSPHRLLAARIQAGLSQPQLAALIERTTSAVWTYENNKAIPPNHVVGLIAQGLGISAVDLYEPDPTDPVLRALTELHLLEAQHGRDETAAPPLQRRWARRPAAAPIAV
ncbi:helix-turn-helix transcriptional regulator [Streptomyces xanthophaeus]|nr:helix-turn-helix transcriptional regulator [Streptomyces xanthophaeus]